MHATIVISALIVLLQGANSASLKNSTKTVTPINDDDDAKSDCGSKYRSADEETRIRCINYEDLVSMKAKLANDDLKDDKGIEESDGFDFDDDSDDEYFDEDTDADDNEDSESKDHDGDSDGEEDDEDEESDDEDEGANSASLKNSTKTVTPINDHDAKSDCGSKYRSADEETRIRCINYEDLVSMKAKLANDDLKDDKGIEESDGFDFDDDSDDEYFDEDTDADDNEDSESKNDDGDSDGEEDDEDEESDDEDEDDDEEESDYEDEGANSASLKNSTKTVTPINDHDAKSDCGSKYRSADEKTRIRCISYEDLVSMKAKLANDDLKDNKVIEEDDDEEESDDENEDDDEEESDDEDEDDDDIFGGWSMKKWWQ